jgi:four helix bundle protein
MSQRVSPDLEDRTIKFAENVRDAFKGQSSFLHRNDVQQLLRSSGSVAANYIESREGLSKKDMIHRLRIARKEARESAMWLRLLSGASPHSSALIQEARELTYILSAIIQKLSP